jgi:rubredoxin-NAD+ reductase
MPVTIKTPACPVVVAPVAPGTAGDWSFEVAGNNVNAQFRDGDGKLIGFALTGEAIKDKTTLQKELPAIMG